MTETHIYGQRFKPETYDLLMQNFVSAEHLSYEALLMDSNWWDYRFMNPCAATYLYAHNYRIEFRAAYLRHKGATPTTWIKPFKDPDLFKNEKRLITAAWRGRQHADALGIPYDLYIRWAFDARMRFWHKPYLPQPQMFYAEMVTDQVDRKWEDYLKGVMMHGKHAAYKAKNYRGLAVQDAHHEWLFLQANKRPDVVRALRPLVLADLLTIDKIAARYGSAVAGEVRRPA